MNRLVQIGIAVLALVCATTPCVQSQEAYAPARATPAGLLVDPRSFVHIVLPPDGPLEVVSTDYGSSRILRKDTGMHMDLNIVLTLRNRSAKPVEGLALAMGGVGKAGTEGLNAVSGIRLESGASYVVPARMLADIEVPATRTPDLPTSLRVRLDSVLFSDGTGYGPDMMRALGAMRINQAESQRDRRFFQALYDSGGMHRLLPVLEKWSNDTAGSADAATQGAPRVLAGEAAERARALAQFADFRVARFASAPLEIISARARVFDGGLVDPSIEIRNPGGSTVTNFQVVWLLRDASGKEFRAATISTSGSGAGAHRFQLGPGESITWTNPAVLGIGARASAPILSGRVYLRAVEFADGHVWVPERAPLEAAGLSPLYTLSPEVIRLFRLYQSRGPAALVAEIRR